MRNYGVARPCMMSPRSFFIVLSCRPGALDMVRRVARKFDIMSSNRFLVLFVRIIISVHVVLVRFPLSGSLWLLNG